MHFQPANAKSLKVRICFMSAGLYFSILSVLSCRSRKAKSQKSFPLKSARNCPTEKVVRSQKSVKSEKSFHVAKRTVRQRLFIRKTLSSCFSHWPITTEAMCIWRLAWAFAVALRQRESGSKGAKLHRSRQMNIGVCYAHGDSVLSNWICCFSLINYFLQYDLKCFLSRFQ